MKKPLQEFTSELFNKVQSIKLNDAAAIFGTSSKESMLQDLRKAVVEFAESIKSDAGYEQLIAKHEAIAAAIDTAGLTGLISEAELPAYYKIVDDIWVQLEKENK